MAATMTSAVWLKLLQVAPTADKALTPQQVRSLVARYTCSESLLPGMSNNGLLARTADNRYFVDSTCQVPNKVCLGDIIKALV